MAMFNVHGFVTLWLYITIALYNKTSKPLKRRRITWDNESMHLIRNLLTLGEQQKKIGTFGEQDHFLHELSSIPLNQPVPKKDFAKGLLDNDWVKVDI